jgi:hypothetical protein
VHEQTGRLKGSWGVAVSGSSIADLKGAAFSFAGVKAPRLELGGDVPAPRGTGPTSGWIFIPTDINRRPDGSAILSPGEVISGGSLYVNRHRRQWQNVPPATIDGQDSPAWNLLVDRNRFALQQWAARFIMVKKAHYRPLLGFYESGGEFGRNVLPGKLADASVKAWKELDKV